MVEEGIGGALNHLNGSKAFIEYWNIEEYNPNKKRKILIVFDEIIADMVRNKKCYPIVT